MAKQQELSTEEQDAPQTPPQVEELVNDMERRFGAGALMRLGDAGGLTVDGIPTGALSLDVALGIGGLPRGAHRPKSTVPRAPANRPSRST